MKKLLYILIFVPLTLFGQESNLYHIPDTNFLYCLQENYPALIINDSLDIDEANLTTGLELYCNSFNNFDGIQYFVNLNSLYIQFDNDYETGLDNFSNIDISSLNNLEDLWIWEANISELSLPNPSNLIGIEIVGSNLPDSIGIINHPNLSAFSLLINGGIKRLVLSELPNLNNLEIIENSTLNSLSLSQLSSLTTLSNTSIYCNPITCVEVYDEQANDILITYLCSPGDPIFYGDLPLCEYNYGCTDSQYFEYDLNANIDDGSCMNLWPDAYQILNNQATNSISSLQQALDTWNTTIDLSAGWNMFGYGCPSSIDVVEGLSNHTESILITKDNNGNVYMPEFGFNGIGDFTPGFGYQIKLTEAIEGFSLCDWYVNDIPEDNIVSLQEYIIQLEDSIEVTNAYHIGDLAEGGIIFYIDETGQHGLVAAMEDIQGTYVWGCAGTSVNGADDISIGTGYQNTMDIVNQGCTTEEHPFIAAQAALDQIPCYSDWYLPSNDELIEMYNTIGNGSTEDNIGVFETDNNTYYWSSSEVDANHAWSVRFSNGYINDEGKGSPGRVRVIRSF